MASEDNVNNFHLGIERTIGRLVKRGQIHHSAAPVGDRIWIGDVATAMTVACGVKVLHAGADDEYQYAVDAEFGAVFNAAALESTGGSLEEGYTRHNILYDTMMDSTTGVTLTDNMATDIDVIAAEMVASRSVERTISVKYKGRLVKAHPTSIVSPQSFLWHMADSAVKIHHLLEALPPRTVLLVHCMAGRNRSAAAIVAYMMLYENMGFENAVDIIRESCVAHRGESALTNVMFYKLLQQLAFWKFNDGMSIEDIYAHTRKEFLEFYDRLMDRCGQFMVAGTPYYYGSVDIDSGSTNRAMVERIRETAQPPLLELITLRGKIQRGRFCVQCGSAALGLKLCGQCKKVYYCSKACQIANWKRHKDACKRADKEN
jgi:hypothetical protein